MRVAVISLAVLAIVAAISPVLVGSRVEGSVHEYVGLYEDIPMYKITVDEYDKGYRSSVVTISFGLDPAIFEGMSKSADFSMDPKQIALITKGVKFDLNIQHGPILTEHGFGLGWSDMSMDVNRENYPELSEFFDLIGTDGILSLKSRVELSGSGWANSELADISVEIPSEVGTVKFVMAGADGDMTFSDFGAVIYEKGSIDEISFSLEAEQTVGMSLKDMVFDGKMIIGDPIWLSQLNYKGDIKSITLDVADEFKMNISDTSFDVVMEEGDSPETMTIKESIRFESADFNEHKVTNGDFSFAYANISKALWTSYMDLAMSPEVLARGEDAEAYVMQELKKVATDALLYNPRFDLDRVAFEYQEGTMDASASFGINSDLLEQPLNLENPLVLVPAVEADASLKINETLLRSIALMNAQQETAALPDEEQPSEEQIQQMIDGQIGMLSGPLVEQGYVVQEGDVFSARFSFSNGEALINGNPIPLPF